MVADIFNLAEFSLLDMLRCSRGLRQVGESATSLNSGATAVVGYLFSQFADPETKEPQCALVRFYRTMSYGELSPDLQLFATRKLTGHKLTADTKVLVLTATVGVEREWCDPALSVGHRAIPLPSVEIVEQAPMIAELIRALGLEIRDVVAPSISLMQDAAGKTYNVFHVERAVGSPFIPAQEDFVERYGIKSVIGFGGLLPSGDLFALVMFSRVPVARGPASRFRSVALDIKAMMHPFAQPIVA